MPLTDWIKPMPSLKKTFIFIAVGFYCTAVFCQVEHLDYYNNYIYEHPNFDRITSGHVKIAVLPIKASIAHYPFEVKSISYEEHKNLEVDAGVEIQKKIYSHLSEREEKGKLPVSVQDPTITDSILKSANAIFEDINEYYPEVLAGLLEVDAIICGTYRACRSNTADKSIINGKVRYEASLKLRLYNAEDGVLLAGINKYHNSIWSLLTSIDVLIEKRLIRKAAKKIPYGR